MRGEPLSLLCFLLPLCLYSLSLNASVATNGEDRALLGLQHALLTRGSLELSPEVDGVDVALFRGHIYSAVAPGLALLSLPFAALGLYLDGRAFTMFGYAALLDEFFLALAASLASYMLYRSCRLYAPPKASALASLAFSFGTSLWPFSTVLFPHAASLLFLTLALYAALTYGAGKGGALRASACGLSLSAASLIEYAAAGLVPSFALYIFVRRPRRGLPAFLASLLPGLLGHLLYNYALFSSPFSFPEQFKLGAQGELWSRFSLEGMALHLPLYLISPYRGLLLYSPVLVLGLYGLGLLLRKQGLRREALLLCSALLIVLMLYSSWEDWAGGLAYGPRFLSLGLPSLTIPLAPLLAQRRWPLAPFLALFTASCFIEGVGALTSAFSVYGSPLTYQPLAYNMPALLEGKISAWWARSLPEAFALPFALLLISLPPLAAGWLWLRFK